MKIDLNKTISFIIIMLGHLLFFLNISSNYPIAFISVVGSIVLWMIWSKITYIFSLDFLLYLILLSGLVSSITIVVVHGVERIGTRHGNLIDFHMADIAIALGILFISTLPYIIFNMKFDLPIKKIKLSPAFTLGKQKQDNRTIQTQYIVDDDDWEIASNSDIQNYIAD
tara:strand:+ start:141 stop:647 length:507 start_codon:yes stop_codon:yes gene_type:complete